MSLMSDNPRIMVLAGETSGDAHAAEFVHEIHRLNPDIKVTAMGGHELQNSTANVFFDSSAIAVVGIWEVIKHWGDIKHAMTIVKQQLDQTRPDLLVLVDYPEFNLKMAAYARELGIRVLFYISPQIWAWRPKRIHKIGRLIDHMAVIFKFEQVYYERANIPVSFVGHPLVDKVKNSKTKDEARAALGLDPKAQVVGLFPGSRRSEINRLLPLMLDSARLLTRNNPALQFVLPVAMSLNVESIREQCNQAGIEVLLIQENFYDLIRCCDAIVCCSGTATLEVALLGIPMCIVYQIAGLSFQIMSRLIKIPHIGLANIIAGREVVRELIQGDATPENIGQEVLKILEDTHYRERIKADLLAVRKNLGEGNGAANMAKLVLAMVKTSHTVDYPRK